MAHLKCYQLPLVANSPHGTFLTLVSHCCKLIVIVRAWGALSLSEVEIIFETLHLVSLPTVTETNTNSLLGILVMV